MCVGKRSEAEAAKSSLEAAFWKEISNSSYGKLAQGLKEKQVFNIKEAGMQVMPPCRVTNPFFAAFTTSFVRATLGELMNKLPPSVVVSNCTTDGFLCTATEEQIATAINGPLFTTYQQYRAKLTGVDLVPWSECLKVKHRIKQPLGWRTRGQATLQSIPNEKIVLAKAGIRTPRECDTDDLQNDWIVDHFINRTPESKFQVDYSPSIRSIILDGDKDWMISENENEKRLAMEFDWKRCPVGSSVTSRSINGTGHLYFDTKPWNSVQRFTHQRFKWQSYNKAKFRVLKTEADFKNFETYASQRKQKGIRTPTVDTEQSLLRKEMAAAFAQKLWGFDSVAPKFRRKEFVAWMNKNGVPMKLYDVANGMKHTVVANRFGQSAFLLNLVATLKSEVAKGFEDSKLWVIPEPAPEPHTNGDDGDA